MSRLPVGVSKHVDRFGKISFRARITVQGLRKSLGLYPTPAEASAVYESALAQLAGEQKGITLAVWGKTWLDRRETDGFHRSASKDRSTWRTHISSAAFALFPLRRISRVDVVKWIKTLLRTSAAHAITKGRGTRRYVADRQELDRKLATQTVRNALGLLRRALGDAADEGLVPTNVALGVRVPRRPTSEETWAYLTESEIADVLALDLRADQRAIFTVAIYAGLRAGELWGLRWIDVGLTGERPELIVRHSYRGPTKGGRVRRVPLLRQAREALEAWRRVAPGVGGALVFPAEIGGDGLAGCHHEGFEAGWPRVRALAGILRRVRFHDLRHTCGSHLVMGSWGRPWRLEEVREILGHRSITTTERYAHLAPDRLHAARAETDAGPRREEGEERKR